MFIQFCQLTLNVLLNLLIFLNKNKKKKETIEGDTSLRGILTLVEEIKSIETERKRMDKKQRLKAVRINNNIEKLNTRLQHIEMLLSDKRADLLKDKILSNDYKEKEEGH